MDSQHLAAHADFAKYGEKTGANLRIESMKKVTKARMPSKAKAPTQKGKGLVNPILDMLKNMDEDVVAMLSSTRDASVSWLGLVTALRASNLSVRQIVLNMAQISFSG